MKFVIFVFSAILFINLNAQNASIKDFAKSNDLAQGSLSFYAYNVSADHVHEAFNENKWMVPASSLKLLTTSLAVEFLGEDYRFETKVVYRGEINNNVLNGDLIVVGGGDPSLGFDIQNAKTKFPQEFFQSVVKQLQGLGIDSIAGKLMVDASYFEYNPIPAGWTWGDIGNYFGAGSYGLNVFGNRYSIYFKPGKMAGSSTTIAEVFPRMELNFENHVKSANISNDQAYIFSAPWSDKIYMEGQIPLHKDKFEVKGSIPDPPNFFLEILEKQLLSAGIKNNGAKEVSYQALKYDHELYLHKSPTLMEIAVYTNKKSDNFFCGNIA